MDLGDRYRTASPGSAMRRFGIVKKKREIVAFDCVTPSGNQAAAFGRLFLFRGAVDVKAARAQKFGLKKQAPAGTLLYIDGASLRIACGIHCSPRRPCR